MCITNCGASNIDLEKSLTYSEGMNKYFSERYIEEIKEISDFLYQNFIIKSFCLTSSKMSFRLINHCYYILLDKSRTIYDIVYVVQIT